MTGPLVVHSATHRVKARYELRRAWHYRTFALYWSRATVSARNDDTHLGRVWNVLNPLLFGAVYFVLIVILAGDRADRGLAFIIGNLYFWSLLSNVVLELMGMMKQGSSVLSQTRIPPLAFAASGVLVAASLFLRSMVVYAPLHILEYGLQPSLLLAPAAVLLAITFACGLGLLAATLDTYIGDVSRLVPHLLRLAMYLSPVIWSLDLVTSPLAKVNPFFWLMTTWRLAINPAEVASPLASISLTTALAVMLLLVGGFVFTARNSRHLQV